MTWPLNNTNLASYWLRVFALYALFEAFIQLLFNYLINSYGSSPISNPEFHLIMWLFQCLLIWPIWLVAHAVYKKPVIVQVLVNILFFIVYSYIWFGPVQDGLTFLHQQFQSATRPVTERLPTPVDTFDYVHYQVLKHMFRLSWFFLANYFYHYRNEEKQRMNLAIANKDLELRLATWHLNPCFYFKTIDHLRSMSAISPATCTRPILQLARVMEYVIYEAKEKMIHVSKEISFLNDYIQLINQQAGNNIRFKLETETIPEKLKISPLLLVGFIDKLAAQEDHDQKKEYSLHLKFIDSNMFLSIHGNMNNQQDLFFRPGEDNLYYRFHELYPNRFDTNFSPNRNLFELNMRLNDE